MRQHYLMAYDVADPGRLRRVARIAEDFGDRVQRSVFTCQLADRDVAVLRQRLFDVIDQGEDSILLIPIGPVRDDKQPPPALQCFGKPVELRDLRCLIF